MSAPRSSFAEPEVQQIVLLDGPAVLGWERWREIGMRYGLGLVEGVLAQAIELGRIPRQPVGPDRHPHLSCQLAPLASVGVRGA